MLFQVIYQQPNPVIYFEYILPREPIINVDSDSYSYSSVLPLGKRCLCKVTHIFYSSLLWDIPKTFNDLKGWITLKMLIIWLTEECRCPNNIGPYWDNETILKISSFFHRKESHTQVLYNMRVNNSWHNFHVWVSYPFKVKLWWPIQVWKSSCFLCLAQANNLSLLKYSNIFSITTGKVFQHGCVRVLKLYTVSVKVLKELLPV